MDNHYDPVDPGLRKIYSNLSDKGLREAEENLDKYLELALRIYERIREDSVEYDAKFKRLLIGEKDRKSKEEDLAESV